MAQVRSYTNQMFPAPRCWRPPPAAAVAATILVVAVLVGVRPASADIGIESVSRTSGIPGERVDLLIYCGGCLPRTVRLPVSLHGGARIASRLGLEIPDAVEQRGAGAVRQWVASINRLRFQIPDAEPGLYTYVIYCCGRAPGGDLIGHPERRPSWNRARLAYAREHGQFLRVRRGASRADEPGGPPWPLWAAIAALTLIVLVAVWRRRATRSG
jgi:hypothetical protein